MLLPELVGNEGNKPRDFWKILQLDTKHRVPVAILRLKQSEGGVVLKIAGAANRALTLPLVRRRVAHQPSGS